MKNVFTLFVVIVLVTGCTQPQPEAQQVEFGMYTSYYLFPETLNGKVKEVIEKTYFAVEEDGAYQKDIPLTVEARDTIGWTLDFKLMFDENGNMVESYNIDENDKVLESWKVSVEDNKMIEAAFTKNDTLTTVSRMTYNEAGVLTKVENFRMPADTLAYYADVITDENGNTIEWHSHNWQVPAGKHMFTVNLEGKRTGYKFFNKEGEQTFEQQYTYNDKGHMIKQVMINREGKEFVSEYDYQAYDEHGNWTSYVAHTDGPALITERIISYYDEE